jgi:sugar/nucleoside kinase (ribokinase family)
MSLFDVNEPRARRTDPATSKAAARRVAPAAPVLSQRILDCLAFRSMTADSICKAIDWPVRHWPTVKACLSRMRKAGKLVWTGEEIAGQHVWARPENVRPLRVVVDGEIL